MNFTPEFRVLEPSADGECGCDDCRREREEARHASLANSGNLGGVELRRALEQRLRSVSPGFMRIVSLNAATGLGAFEERVDGKTKRSSFSFELDGEVVRLLSPELRGAEEPDYAPRDPYAAELKMRAAAAATPESFEDTFKAARFSALAAEHAEWALDAEQLDQREALRTAAQKDLEQYAPPDPYAAGLKLMKEQNS